ncbi:hypothetical protein V5799_024446, partial [Amblyomma americanum]
HGYAPSCSKRCRGSEKEVNYPNTTPCVVLINGGKQAVIAGLCNDGECQRFDDLDAESSGSIAVASVYSETFHKCPQKEYTG